MATARTLLLLLIGLHVGHDNVAAMQPQAAPGALTPNRPSLVSSVRSRLKWRVGDGQSNVDRPASAPSFASPLDDDGEVISIRVRLMLFAPFFAILAVLLGMEGIQQKLGVDAAIASFNRLLEHVRRVLTPRNRGLLCIVIIPFIQLGIFSLFRSIHSVTETAKRVQLRLKYTPTDYADSPVAAPALPLEVLCVALTAIEGFQLLGPKNLLGAWLPHSRKAQLLLVELCAAWALLRLIAAAKTEAKGDADTDFAGYGSRAESIRFARANTLAKAASICVSLGAIVLALSTVGVDVRALLAVSGASGIVLGLAGREVLANFLGGIIIYLSQPFSVGDWIHTQDGSIDGIVERIGWYYTRVNTWDRRPIYVPNAKFYTMAILNASRMSHRRILHKIRIKLADADKMPNIVREIRQMIVTHPKVDRRQHRLIWFSEIGDHSLDIFLSCYARPSDFFPAQQDVLLSISKIVRENGASFASSLERENISPRQGETVPFPSNEADAAAPPATLHPEVAASVKSERPPPGFAPAESLDAESCR